MIYWIVLSWAVLAIVAYWFFYKTRLPLEHEPILTPKECGCPACTGKLDHLEEYAAQIIAKTIETGKPVSGIIDANGNLKMTVHDDIIELDDPIEEGENNVH